MDYRKYPNISQVEIISGPKYLVPSYLKDDWAVLICTAYLTVCHYTVWIHSETRTWHDNIQSNAPHR